MPKKIKISKVQVFPFKQGPNLGHMKGLATICFNDCLLIRGLRIVSREENGQETLSVIFPVDPFYRGDEYKSIVTPMNSVFRDSIQTAVIEKYKEAIK